MIRQNLQNDNSGDDENVELGQIVVGVLLPFDSFQIFFLD